MTSTLLQALHDHWLTTVAVLRVAAVGVVLMLGAACLANVHAPRRPTDRGGWRR